MPLAVALTAARTADLTCPGETPVWAAEAAAAEASADADAALALLAAAAADVAFGLAVALRGGGGVGAAASEAACARPGKRGKGTGKVGERRRGRWGAVAASGDKARKTRALRFSTSARATDGQTKLAAPSTL